MREPRTLKALAKYLEFETEGEAAEYIYMSRVNGNNQQARELFAGLEPQEKRECIEYLRDLFGDEDITDSITDWLCHSAAMVHNSRRAA